MFILFIFLEKIILSEFNRFKSIFLLTVYSSRLLRLTRYRHLKRIDSHP